MPSDPIFRVILLVLGLDVVAGALLMILSHYGRVGEAAGDAGAALGIVGGLLYLFFRWWGRRRERERSLADPDNDQGPS